MYKYFFNWYFKFYALIFTIFVFSESKVNATKLTVSAAVGTLIAIGIGYFIKQIGDTNKGENKN